MEYCVEGACAYILSKRIESLENRFIFGVTGYFSPNVSICRDGTDSIMKTSTFFIGFGDCALKLEVSAGRSPTLETSGSLASTFMVKTTGGGLSKADSTKCTIGFSIFAAGKAAACR